MHLASLFQKPIFTGFLNSSGIESVESRTTARYLSFSEQFFSVSSCDSSKKLFLLTIKQNELWFGWIESEMIKDIASRLPENSRDRRLWPSMN